MTVLELNEKFTIIYVSTYNDILRYVVSKCQKPEDIHDLIQNIYLNFYNKFKKGAEIKEPQKYLIKIAKHEIYKLYGFWAINKNIIPVFSCVDYEDFSNFELELSSVEICDDKLNCQELWEYIKHCDLLTFKIFVLYFNHDLKIKDVSKILNVNESTVKNRLYRTINEMREKFNL